MLPVATHQGYIAIVGDVTKDLRSPGRVVAPCLALILALVLPACAHGRQHWLVLKHPISPKQELKLPFGTRSQWLQPWRAYLTTPPASNINNGLGINFNVDATDAPATAAVLAKAGFRRARVEIGWGSVDPSNPDQLIPYDAAQDKTLLSALFQNHIRPLILLNANEGMPTATQNVSLDVLAPALAGARQVVLSPTSLSQVVPGRTGFNSLTGGYEAAAVLITAVKGPIATLSAPLPRTLTPGVYSGSTLSYSPFSSPGSPGFSQTLSGWLSYVQTVANLARQIGHGDGFDVEVWNEVSFGSDFLNVNNYYSPPIDAQAPASGVNTPTDVAIVTATANLIHQEYPGVQVGDGFADQVPWTSGQTELPGVEIDKHYYNGTETYPADDGPSGVKPVDWLGRTFASFSKVNGADDWTPFWVPSYTAYFPEYWLTGLQTETLIRDLTPLQGENIYAAPHGRYTHPPGAPAPQVWMTEYNLDAPATPLSAAQAEQLQAKVALRYLLAFINKGLGFVDFYAAEGSSLNLVSSNFFSSVGTSHLANPGLTIDALRRMSQYIHTAPRMRRRSVALLQIATTDHRNVFNGSGRYPPLRNLDVAAFFPYQEATHRFVFAAYVMTRDLLRVWQKPGPDEYNMPPASYRFKIGKVDGCHTSLSAYNPLTDRKVPIRRVACSAHTLTLQTQLTDSPILIQASGA